MDIIRAYQNIQEYLEPNKVLVIYGPRQVGKTTLLRHFVSQTNLRYKFETGEDIRLQELFASNDLSLLKAYAEGYQLLIIDEAQKIPNIGQALKLLVDHIPNIYIIATGSASFELAGQLGEPLTGRKNTLQLYPIAQMELQQLYNTFELGEHLEDWLVFGSYPEIITASTREKKIQRIEELTHSYLLKDILSLDRIKNSKTLLDLLRLIAFQVGNEVSLSELGQQLGIDFKTVARYLDLLEKTFVLYNLRGFSRNLRKEITKKSKYYFYDVGIRNALIANFNPLSLRNDIGQLWENFLCMERLKKRQYQSLQANDYFWRTWDQQEIDLIEEREGNLFAYEFKWNEKRIEAPTAWAKAYPTAVFSVITRANYLDFVT